MIRVHAINIYIFNVFSDVNSSGPKGIVKSDIISHISQRNLQPIKPESPKAAAAAKRAATAPLRATKPRYVVSLLYRVIIDT